MKTWFRSIMVAVLVSGIFLVPAGASAQQKSLVVGGSSVGGLYYIWAGGWAKVMQEKLGYTATAEATGGAAANIRLVHQGDIDAGITTMGALYAGMNGKDWAKGTKFDNVRVIFPAYQSFMQFWALKRSGMTNLRDLNGKVFSPGTAGGTAAVEGPRIFELLGIKPSRIVHVGYSDANGQLSDGLLDVVAAATGVPSPQITDLSASHDVNVLGLNPSDSEKVTAAMPYFSPGEIPAGTYKGQASPIKGLVIWNVFIVGKSMSDDAVYNLVKTTFENQKQLELVHVSAKETVAANAAKIRAPFHPGALRYYREKGISIAQ